MSASASIPAPISTLARWICSDLPNRMNRYPAGRILHRAGLRHRLQWGSRGGCRFPPDRCASQSVGKTAWVLPPHSWVLPIRTDWSKRSDPVAYQNLDEPHTWSRSRLRWLPDGFQRDVLGFGAETIGTDPPGSPFFAALSVSAPCAARRVGLQCLCNLDRLRQTGALIVAAPLKIRQGSGSPLRRVFAIAPGR